MVPKWLQDAPKMEPKSLQNWSKIHPKIDAKIDTEKISKNMQKYTKNDAKIDHFLDAFKNAILKDFGSIFGRKMEACWDQIESKIDVNFKRPILQKVLKKPIEF